MSSLLRNLHRNAFGPRSVDSIVSSLNTLHDDLKHATTSHRDQAAELRRQAYLHEAEMAKAERIAARVNALVS